MLKTRRAETALTVIPQQRSPEREALAIALAERARRREVVAAHQARAAALQEARQPLYAEQERLERQLGDTDSLRVARLEALAAGEDPGELPTPETLLARHAVLDAEATAGRAASRTVEAEVERLAERVRWADLDVSAAVTAVLASEPCLPELASEYRRVAYRKAILERALIGAFNEGRAGLPPAAFPPDEPSPPLPPCPWQFVAERLKDDPDARFPALEQSLGLLEPTPD